ncbi:RNA polymerase sigma factor [Clostridium sp. OS1-26]|uniref:RNA polymerase sigma factor n=1 Tax=Clostridium sp. OS1-26 TaxID=3070681 RepID=UPI0027DFACC3|nr:RNA polymerase sigma factor [Clostridium sp. OS1-26]WML33489.1 RNA polymerase sigma factor [Clostridium sp. OS1-26]
MNFIEVFREYNRYIYSYAYKLTNHKESAEDLTQETFLKAYKEISQLRDKDSIRFWLRRICFNTHLMNLRKLKKLAEIPYGEMLELQQLGNLINIDNSIPSIEDEIIVEETIKKIQNGCFLTMVHRLSENQRIVFSLVDMFGLSTEEVSKIINLTESATKALLYRARVKLDKFFGENCSLVDVKNPCSCKAWNEFTNHREKMKKNFLESKNDRKGNLTCSLEIIDSDIEKKLRYLYANMPDHKPSNEWYEDVLSNLKKMF